MQAGGAEQTEDETPRFRNRLIALARSPSAITVGAAEARRVDREHSQTLAHGGVLALSRGVSASSVSPHAAREVESALGHTESA